VIGLPFNDLRCLGSITEVVAELVTNQDPVIVELAKKHSSTTALAMIAYAILYVGYRRMLPGAPPVPELSGKRRDDPTAAAAKIRASRACR
jgi:hypothetical protein